MKAEKQRKKYSYHFYPVHCLSDFQRATIAVAQHQEPILVREQGHGTYNRRLYAALRK